MRESKFKVWDKKKKEWLDRNSIAINGHGEPVAPDETWLEHNLADLQYSWFTGLKDKKRTKEYPRGQEIYEGDILKSEVGEVGRVVFSQASFSMEYLPPHDWDPMCPCEGISETDEIIGNIYKNPEMIEANP